MKHESPSDRQALAEEALSGVRAKIDDCDNDIVELLAERQKLVKQASQYKIELGLSPRQPTRFKEIKQRRLEHAERLGLDPALAEDVWDVIHEHSVRMQEEARTTTPHNAAGTPD